MLTFANAKLYNPAPTDVHVMATALEQFWAPRWEALRARSSDVRESLAAERECAVRNSEEIKARRKLANEEMRCAGIAADLDAARRRLEDLKRSASRTARHRLREGSGGVLHSGQSHLLLSRPRLSTAPCIAGQAITGWP